MIEGSGVYTRQLIFYRTMEEIRNQRLANKLSTKEVAKSMGVKKKTVERMEMVHQGDFSYDLFLRYAYACGAWSIVFSEEVTR